MVATMGYRYQSQVQVITSTDKWAYKSEVLITPFLGLVDMLKQLTGLRNTFYLLDHQFAIQGNNSEIGRQKRYIRQVMGKRHGACIPPLRAQLFSKLHVFINLEASESCPFGCLLRSHFTGMLIKSSLMTTNSTFRPSALTRDQRSGAGYINPLITWVVLLATSAHPFPKIK